MQRIKANMVMLLVCTAIFMLTAVQAYADKSAASIEAPKSAALGSTISVKIIVTHSGNNFLHYTKWVRVTINGAEAARWDFSWNRRPESETFTREISVVVEGPLTIEAEARCNVHGSRGVARAIVVVDRQEGKQ